MLKISYLVLSISVVWSVGSGTAARGQSSPQSTVSGSSGRLAAANPSDVASPDAIIAAANDVISGPAGQKRDWGRMFTLFYPGAQLIRTARSGEDGMSVAFFSPEEYTKRAERYFKDNGFWEKEISRTSEGWANILQVFSTYESRHDPKDAVPFARGINSYQLLFDGKRWWILTIYWQEETPSTPIPTKYLGGAH